MALVGLIDVLVFVDLVSVGKKLESKFVAAKLWLCQLVYIVVLEVMHESFLGSLTRTRIQSQQ